MRPRANGSKQIAFSLRSEPNKLNELIETLSHETEPVTVIGVIGKSRVGFSACKAGPVDQSMDQLWAQNLPETDPIGSEIQALYDSENHLLILHLVSCLDSDILLSVVKKHERLIHEQGLPVFWSHVNCDLSRCLLLIFLVSHVILISTPTLQFDLNYIELFKSCESLRLKTRNQICSSLKREIPSLPKPWLDSGRPCSPRALFLFLTPELLEESNVKSHDRTHALFLEDQIYRFLRRARVITNICANSLLAICNQMDFVYLLTNDTCIRNPDNLLERIMGIQNGKSQSEVLSPQDSKDSSFYSFLWKHLHLAATKGFDDNVGRHNVVPVFERTNLHQLLKVMKVLKTILLEQPLDENQLEENLNAQLNFDVDDENGQDNNSIVYSQSDPLTQG